MEKLFNAQEDRKWVNEESKTRGHCDSEAIWMAEIIEPRLTNCRVGNGLLRASPHTGGPISR